MCGLPKANVNACARIDDASFEPDLVKATDFAGKHFFRQPQSRVLIRIGSFAMQSAAPQPSVASVPVSYPPRWD
jgi:hypothetical protein